MIVLKKITPLIPNIVLVGTLSGTMNSSNQIFTTEYDYVLGNIAIDHNGQTLYSPGDFLESGSNEITFIYVAPGPDEVIRATYEKTTA